MILDNQRSISMKIFRSTENVYNAVDSVVKYGFAAVHGTKSEAVPFCSSIIEELKPNIEISPTTGYENVNNQGYLYYVFDLNRFKCGDSLLKEKIHELDRINPV